MGGVYGDVLSAFPELMVEHTVFRADALHGGGYGERYDLRTAIGYLSWRRGDAAAVQGASAEHDDLGTLWEKHDGITDKRVIKHNDYFETKDGMYRLLEDADFGREGNYSKWKVKRVPGLTDTQYEDEEVNLGAGDFS